MRVAAFDEPLEDHLAEVGRCSEALARRLRLGLGHEAWLAGVLHDLGKALSPYQPLLRGKGKAPGHEVYSALVVSLLPDGAFEGYVLGPAELRAVATYVALMHHQAIADLPERISTALNFIRDKLSGWERDADAEYLASLLESLLGSKEVRGTAEQAVEVIAMSVNRGDPRVINENISKAIRPLLDSRLLYKARMLTGVVMMSDTYVAMRRRHGRPSGVYRTEIVRLFESLDHP